MPSEVWDTLIGPKGAAEDHPQFRFRKLMAAMNISHTDVSKWPNASDPNKARNALISLSLRPAPVTDQWLKDGPEIGDLTVATQGMTLIEAPSPRAEAETIALRLRQAAQDGITAALITPDRTLTRQVAAALDYWDIVPDDSAGVPLNLSPPGRFLRHITEMIMRRYGPPFPDGTALRTWAEKKESPERQAWADWVAIIIDGLQRPEKQSLKSHIEGILAVAQAFAGGMAEDSTGELWEKAAGREAWRVCQTIVQNADAGGDMSATEFAGLLNALLADGVVRDRDAGHPNILIWGTLEARVQSADLVILGGMNEGVWPEAPSPDPWLNRKMRAAAGLLLPERRIGLSAHDYQQAVASKDVWITRAKRSTDAETVPSRWVNRLTNLLAGLPKQNGPEALAALRAEGDRWMAMAATLSVPTEPVKNASRPSPRPPVTARPTEISVTQIKTLIRDPYAIYASKVLRLRPLDPLKPEADAPLRGIIIHAILDKFIASKPDAGRQDRPCAGQHRADLRLQNRDRSDKGHAAQIRQAAPR